MKMFEDTKLVSLTSEQMKALCQFVTDNDDCYDEVPAITIAKHNGLADLCKSDGLLAYMTEYPDAGVLFLDDVNIKEE